MSHATKTRFLEIGSPFPLRDGGTLPQVRIAYETWGELNAEKSNAILVCHALSGSHHAAGRTPSIEGVGQLWQEEMHAGWWDDMIGPGKAIDTKKHFVICANYLGGCYGSTGPGSVNPETGRHWGSSFPAVTATDQVNALALLLDELGIGALHAIVGPSVGGLVALSFATRLPERVRNVIAIASGFKTTVLNRLILFEQILAIENDPHFNGGDYYEGEAPTYGLALARMISHKTFVHLNSIERRARKDVVQPDDVLAWYKVRDQFQSYMLHQGKKFVQRFDATLEGDAETPAALFQRSRAANQRWLVFSIDSDFCFYPEEQADLVKHLERAKVDCMHITVHSEKGHDSFLLEPNLYTPHIAWMLER